MRNIVLITMDTVRADHCSFLGYKRKTTPTMEKMKKNGIIFNNAIAPAPRTVPSMPQIVTGELMTALTQDLRRNILHHLKIYPTITEKLAGLGYETIGFTPNPYTSSYFGFNKGFKYFQDFLLSNSTNRILFEKIQKGSTFFKYVRHIKNLILKEESFKPWESYYGEILKQIEKTVDSQKPFFLWVFLLDTHFPWIIPRKYRKWANFWDMMQANWQIFKLRGREEITLPDNLRKKMINSYDNAIYYADMFVKRLIKDIKEFDPVIIIHADHGEGFGEHGFYGHDNPKYLYNENIHVPLIVYNSEYTRLNIETPFSLLNMPELILTLALEDPHKLENFLEHYKNRPVICKDFDYKTGKPTLCIILNHWKLIIKKDNFELYNLIEDPEEKINVEDRYPILLKEMKKLAKKYLEEEVEKRAIYKSLEKIKRGGKF